MLFNWFYYIQLRRFFSFFIFNPYSKQSINRPPNTKSLAECYVSTTFPRSGSSSHFSNLLETSVKNDKVSDICFKSNDNVPSLDDTNSQNIIECNVTENADANRSSTWDATSITSSMENSVIPELEIKSLTDINISLQDIKPGNIFFLYFSL